MHTATRNLENDHVYILRLIDLMEKMVINCTTEYKHMEMVVQLIKNYADGFHHAKEEQLLFPLLVKKGFSNEHGPVSVMLHEHVEGRQFVKKMSDGLVIYNSGDTSALPIIYENMQGYIDLLRAHIGKENNVLFVMANKALSDNDQAELLDKFITIEKNYEHGRVDEFILDIEGLEACYE